MGRDIISGGTKRLIKFERISKATALNVLYIRRNTKTISVAYRSEYNNKRKKQALLLMITNDKKSHYLAVTNLSVLFKENHQITKNIFIV